MSGMQKQTTAKKKKVALTHREYAKNKRIMMIMIAFLAVVIAFVLGFLVRSNTAIMDLIGMPGAPSASTTDTTPAAKHKTTYNSLSMRISETEDILSSFSFDTINLDTATESMIEALMKSTDDPYAEYYTQERYETYMKENANRNFSGIGLLLGDYNGRAYVIDVLEGSQAQADGVRQGDFVKAIDGESRHTWSASEVIGALSQENRHEVVITWMRPISMDATTGEEFTTTLEIASYDVENVTSSLDDTVGYIKLRQITGNSAELVKEAVEKLAASGAQAYVLDIDDNPGGFLTQSLEIASLFTPSGVLVGIETPEGVTTRTASGETITTAPLVVMMNNYTSGVAEVLAAALQDNSRATTVGQKTRGKGSVQVTRELSFGGAIRYTAAYYISPNGQSINDTGVMPNIEVAKSQSEDENTQYLVALDIARSMIGS